jgi:hypothetical protein
VTSPAPAVAERVAADWVRALLGLPACSRASPTAATGPRRSSTAPSTRGKCWAGGSRWHGKAVMRISVSGWQTEAADADRSADAILAALRAVTG